MNANRFLEHFQSVIARMRERDVEKNIRMVKEQVAGLQTNTNEASAKAKQGHFKLQKKRTVIPKEYLQQTTDVDKLNLCMLNDYLNGYTEKLSRGNPFDPSEIKLDQLNFTQVTKAVGKKTYNPYFQFFSLKKQA